MRCPDCNKFVGYGDPELDLQNLEVDQESGEVTAEGEVTLPCAECSTTLKTWSFSDSYQPDYLIHALAVEGEDGHDMCLEVEEVSAEVSEQKARMYQVDVTFKVTCTHPGCGFELEGTMFAEEQASAFEEQV